MLVGFARYCMYREWKKIMEGVGMSPALLESPRTTERLVKQRFALSEAAGRLVREAEASDAMRRSQ